MKSDTPRSDERWELLHRMGWEREQMPVEAIMESHEQLERELADFKANATFRIAQLQNELAAKDAHADEIYKAAVELAAKLEGDLEKERALADRLAGLLKRHRAGYGGQLVDPECDCCDCEYLAPIDEALASWKQARGKEA